jgi:DNA topoisomerase I
MNKLVIVESPSKSRTIEKYLGSGYKVTASMGHIMDLATSGKFGLGVDVENNFKPTYEPIKGKKTFINDLKKLSKNYDVIYLATDPDREGEAISWHLKEALKINDDNYYRVTFHEVTKDKIKEAFENPGKINFDLVKSQETRRILDRIIGFRLSKLMQAKTSGASAGRVQSVAVKLIVDREREILAFIPEEYWTITSIFKDFEAKLFKYKKDDLTIPNEETADKIISSLSSDYKVESVEKKTRKRSAKLPFTTSSLQQESSNKLNFAAKRTMKIAQTLYEGINLKNERVGLITYMRSDSTRLSDSFIDEANSYILKTYGDSYKGYVKKDKNKENVQDAHEGIRPTSIYRTPESVKEYLTDEEFKLYELIYYRTLASLMADAKIDGTTIIFDNNDYKFKLTGQILIFDGYLKVYSKYETSEDKILPDIKEGEVYQNIDIEKVQHFTEPPARYTEAKLIKELEELGIGRPSTYATIISTIQDRKYVVIEKKNFKPTEIGFEVTDMLQEGFSEIINVKYTANMETDLDKIADGKEDNIKFLTEFWNKFETLVEQEFKNLPKKEAEKTGEICPECGSDLVKRKSKYGFFTACSNYPECKYIKKENTENDNFESEVIGKCPICKKGDIVTKKTRTGKIFYGCTNYPKCKAATWDLPTLNLCPKCKSMLVNKEGTIKCSNVKCDYQE